MLVAEQPVKSLFTGKPVPGDAKAEWRTMTESFVRRSLQQAAECMFSSVSETDPERRASLFKSSTYIPDLLLHLPSRAFCGLELEASPSIVDAPLELSLRPDCAVSEEIASQRILNRLDRAAAYPLWHLRNRSEALHRDSELMGIVNRTFPNTLVPTLSTAIRQIVSDTDGRAPILESLERPLVDQAYRFYSSLNEILERFQFGANETRSLTEDATIPQVTASNTLPTFLIPLLWMPGERPDPHLTRDALEPLALLSQVAREGLRDLPEDHVHEVKSLISALGQAALEHRTTLYRCGHRIWSLLDPIAELSHVGTLARRTTSAHLAEKVRSISLEAHTGEHVTSYLLDDLRNRCRFADPAAANRDAARTQFLEVANGRDLSIKLLPWIRDFWLPLSSVVHQRFGANSPAWSSARLALTTIVDCCRWIPWMNQDLVIEQIGRRFEHSMATLQVPPQFRNRPVCALIDALRSTRSNDALLDPSSFKPRAGHVPAPFAMPFRSTDAALAEELQGAAALWRTACPHGAWFRYFNRDFAATCWGTIGCFYPGTETLSIRTIESTAEYSIRREHLLSDLCFGRAEPIDPAPEQAYAINQLTEGVTRDFFPVQRPSIRTAG